MNGEIRRAENYEKQTKSKGNLNEKKHIRSKFLKRTNKKQTKYMQQQWEYTNYN